MSDSRADDARYAAERVMEPILRRWFAIDLEPVNLWSNAENAAVDLSYALEDAGLLLQIQLVIKGAMSADLKCSDEGATGLIAAMERVAVDALRSKRDGYRSVIQEIADTSEDAATVRFARRALGFDEGER